MVITSGFCRTATRTRWSLQHSTRRGKRGDYESVRHVDGDKVRHYALTDPTEYFAEGTEAYFGVNDFYPYVQTELETHDPELYRLLKELWGSRGQSDKYCRQVSNCI